jgi:uncharacterized protein (TIGR03032 family)
MSEDAEQIPPSEGADHNTASSLKPRTPPRHQFYASTGLGAWLDSQNGCLLLSTMETGVLLLLSGDGSGRLVAGGRKFDVPRGLSIDAERMWVAGDTRLFQFVNRGPQTVNGVPHDALYAPQRAYFVGDSLLHDIAHTVSLHGEQFEVAFVNTNFSVIATVDRDHSFRPLWKPKHISSLAAEDRCHLNCLGIRDGEIAYISLFSLTDTAEGWRHAGPDAGAIIDVASHEVVCSDLSQPHSLKWHRDKLWALNSGAGEFGYVDMARNRFVRVAYLGNFLRGLCMIGDYAIVGATKFRGKPFRNEISLPGFESSANAGAMSAVYVVGLNTGAVAHMALMHDVDAIYDIGFVPGVTRPLVAKLGALDDNRKWTSYDSAAIRC